jgi:hypothetical protein
VTIVARYSNGVRLGLVVVFLLPLCAYSEKLFRLPTAYTLLSGEHRVVLDTTLEDKRLLRFVLESGITLPGEQFFELALNYDETFNQHTLSSIDVQYGILQPITGYVPGCAIGISDLFDDQYRHPSLYVVFSYQFPFVSDWSEMEYIRLSGGVKFRGSAFFMSVMLPFYKRFELISEWESSRFVVGLNWRFSNRFSTRLLYEKSRPVMGIYFSTSF